MFVKANGLPVDKRTILWDLSARERGRILGVAVKCVDL